jgi:ribonuclease T1
MMQGWRNSGAGLPLLRTWLAACLLALALPALARGPAPGEGVALKSMPREAQNTYALVLTGGPFPYAKDGVTFGNREGALPRQKRGYYREYTVPTPGARNRGARRIVCGGAPEEWSRNRPAACFYTDDHYATFRQIRE